MGTNSNTKLSIATYHTTALGCTLVGNKYSSCSKRTYIGSTGLDKLKLHHSGSHAFFCTQLNGTNRKS